MSNTKKILIALAIIFIGVLIYGYYNGWFSRWGIGNGERKNECGKCIEQQTIAGNPDPEGWCNSTASGTPPKCGNGGGTIPQQIIYVTTKTNGNGNTIPPIDILPSES